MTQSTILLLSGTSTFELSQVLVLGTFVLVSCRIFFFSNWRIIWHYDISLH